MNRRRQPHRIPPPLSHGAESLDAEVVLHEFPDDLGLYLWKTVRSVRLWVELPEVERRGAFGREAFGLRMEHLRTLPIEADIRELLETAATVLRDAEIHLEAVVTACRLIAAWADRRGALGTALEFTQVAALLTPGDAELVHSVARVARQRGEYARAESWYRQAIAVSRRTHDWISLAGAYLGLGNTFLLRGNHGSARSTLIRGVRAAERHSLREERALLSHQLAIAAGRAERSAEVVRHGRSALEGYGSSHPRLPVLAVDLGVLWTRMGHFQEAAQILGGVSPGEVGPAERLARAAALARASAALGDAEGYAEAWAEAGRNMEEPMINRERGEALLDLAYAAVSANEAAHLRDAVQRYSKLGDSGGDAERRSELERLLDAFGDGGAQEPVRKLSRDGRGLAADLVATLHPALVVV
jgi:tetratricopeptide (TPR) repeat protein